MKSLLDISSIRNRSISLSRSSTFDSKHNYNMARRAINENVCIGMYTNSFLESCTNADNANKYYTKCLWVLENAYDKRLMDKFINKVLPCIKDLDTVKESVMNIPRDDIREPILSAIKENKICDRVINNTKAMSKRFNFDKIIEHHRYKPLEIIVSEFCNLIDTYDMPLYGKMNIALEQLSYYLQKHAVDYDRKELSSTILEYFVYTYPLNEDDKINMYNVLKGNLFIEEADIPDNVSSPSSIGSTDTTDPVERAFLLFVNSARDMDSMYDCLETLVKLPDDILIKQMPRILGFLRYQCANSILGARSIKNTIEVFTKEIADKDLTRDQIEKIMSIYRDMSEFTLRMYDSESRNDAINEFISVLTNEYSTLKVIASDMYPDMELDSNRDFQAYKESTDGAVMSLDEFKLFKFHNLFTALFNLDRYLARKNNTFLKNILNKTKVICNNTRKFFFKESGEFDISAISNNQYFDVCVRVYESLDQSYNGEIHKNLAMLCNIINEGFTIPEGTRVYYTSIGERFELHFEDSTYINLTEAEKEELSKVFTEYDMYNMEELSKASGICDVLVNQDYDKISESIESIDDPELLCSIVEALMYSNTITDEYAQYMIDSYTDSHYDDFAGNTLLHNFVWEDTVYPLEIQKEALIIAKQCLSEKVDLNSIKLALTAMRDKAKKLGAKEKELSRNADAAVSHFSNSMQRALTNDRREAIIKGSIIPSFSKCIKTGIALAGIGALGGPIAAAITAFAGLAVSKMLNDKERKLMLDEIDIELQVLEKEISHAEDAKNMKKYRELVTYQKKLQREKQRIKYNIKASGGTDLPDSSIGTAYKKDND